MTWVRKDDQMPIHRKVAPLSDAAYRLHDEAMCWASRNGTNGRVAVEELETISKRGTPKNAAELVRRQLWHRAEDPACPNQHTDPPTCAYAGPDGWVIHDYLDYNPSRERVKEVRHLKAERQRRWRDRHTSQDAAKTRRVDGEVDAPRDGAPRARVSPTRPAPSRPEGSGTGGARPEGEALAARPAGGSDAGGEPDQNLDQPNGRPHPPDLTGLRATLAGAASRARAGRRDPAGALDELRAATPELAIPTEDTWQPAQPGDTPGQLEPGEADAPQPVELTTEPAEEAP